MKSKYYSMSKCFCDFR